VDARAQHSELLDKFLSAKRVLCVQPHYDDNDIYAGGTIARLHDAGAEIIYLTVTDDLVGFLDQSLSDEKMSAQLRAEQIEAGKIIGVDNFYWLNYPDASKYDYYRLRQDIIDYIRLLQPDFILTVDPWLPYEAHRDHILTGQAASEALLVGGFSRLASNISVPSENILHRVTGIAYYNTAWPNSVIDIGETWQRKHTAMRVFKAQFSSDEIDRLIDETSTIEAAAGEPYRISHAEELKLVTAAQLHGNTKTWRS
jgi:N,N'-diacetylchitobiose non-reducing end deacetylase